MDGALPCHVIDEHVAASESDAAPRSTSLTLTLSLQIQMTVSGCAMEDVEELLEWDAPKVFGEQLEADGFDCLLVHSQLELCLHCLAELRLSNAVVGGVVSNHRERGCEQLPALAPLCHEAADRLSSECVQLAGSGLHILLEAVQLIGLLPLRNCPDLFPCLVPQVLILRLDFGGEYHIQELPPADLAVVVLVEEAHEGQDFLL
mmetsp:Transcript_17335/g.30928  ORF Transcript_17335/g.30928 Transcript_17335/m.30928 type:complete len:204 (+) Transcript_17335:958-1569(+)